MFFVGFPDRLTDYRPDGSPIRVQGAGVGFFGSRGGIVFLERPSKVKKASRALRKRWCCEEKIGEVTHDIASGNPRINEEIGSNDLLNSSFFILSRSTVEV